MVPSGMPVAALVRVTRDLLEREPGAVERVMWKSGALDWGLRISVSEMRSQGIEGMGCCCCCWKGGGCGCCCCCCCSWNGGGCGGCENGGG